VTFHQAVSVTIAGACVLSMVGCGGDKTSSIPTNLNQPLPPPPVSGGGEKPKQKPQEPSVKAE
jgi:hypothetical protein